MEILGGRALVLPWSVVMLPWSVVIQRWSFCRGTGAAWSECVDHNRARSAASARSRRSLRV